MNYIGYLLDFLGPLWIILAPFGFLRATMNYTGSFWIFWGHYKLYWLSFGFLGTTMNYTGYFLDFLGSLWIILATFWISWGHYELYWPHFGFLGATMNYTGSFFICLYINIAETLLLDHLTLNNQSNTGNLNLHINRFNPTTFLCLSQTRTRICNLMPYVMFFFVFNDLSWEFTMLILVISLYINFLLIILILKVKKKLFTENFNFFLYGEVLVIPTYLLKCEDFHQFISIIFNLSRFQFYCVGPSVLLITKTFDLFGFPICWLWVSLMKVITESCHVQ